MRKTLSIIIPKFKETELDIFPLLTSINNQVGFSYEDIEIIISLDGPEAYKLDEDFLSMFKVPIRQIQSSENKGPGVARQNGLDASTAKYVMFCDADDCLQNVGVIGAMLQEIEKTQAEILTSQWIEELWSKETGYIYKTHEIENTWMFGKMFNREFLVNNGIKFHDELRVHEDSYFLSIVMALAKNPRHLPVTTYVWKYQPNSITRINNGIYTFDSRSTFIEACTMSFMEIEKLNKSQMNYKIVQFVLYNYFSYHRPEWLDKSTREFLKKGEESFVKNMKYFWHYWKECDRNYIAEIYTQERDKNFKGCIESETLDDWIKRLGLE